MALFSIIRIQQTPHKKTTILRSGVPDGSGTNILCGTVTTTVVGLGAQVLTNTVVYKASGVSDIVMDQDIYTYLDARNRSYQIAHLDGTTEQFNYACCGLDSQVNRDGTTTDYLYDALQRQIGSVVNGITLTNQFEATGSTLVTARVSTNGSHIYITRSAFDLAARPVKETNALSGVTTYTNYFDGSHQLIKQSTYPDGGTRIETYAQDGALLGVSPRRRSH